MNTSRLSEHNHVHAPPQNSSGLLVVDSQSAGQPLRLTRAWIVPTVLTPEPSKIDFKVWTACVCQYSHVRKRF